MPDLARQALADSDLYSLMDAAVDTVVCTLDVECAGVLELLPSGDSLLLRAGMGWEAGLVGDATVRSGPESQAGYTLTSDSPVIAEDLSAETRFREPPLLVQHRVVSGMTVVIFGRARPWGVLGAYTRSRRHFSPDDTHFLQATANTLAEAIRRVGVEHALRTARDQERRLRERLEASSEQGTGPKSRVSGGPAREAPQAELHGRRRTRPSSSDCQQQFEADHLYPGRMLLSSSVSGVRKHNAHGLRVRGGDGPSPAPPPRRPMPSTGDR